MLRGRDVKNERVLIKVLVWRRTRPLCKKISGLIFYLWFYLYFCKIFSILLVCLHLFLASCPLRALLVIPTDHQKHIDHLEEEINDWKLLIFMTNCRKFGFKEKVLVLQTLSPFSWTWLRLQQSTKGERCIFECKEFEAAANCNTYCP